MCMEIRRNRIRTQESVRCLWAAMLCMCMIGCGNDSGGVSVSGKVTLDGTPLAKGVISFVPESTGSPATGEIESGNYRIKASQGPTAGSYRVEIRAPRNTGQTAVKPVDPDYAGEVIVESVAPRYNRDSVLKAEVKTGADNVFDFALETPDKTRPKR